MKKIIFVISILTFVTFSLSFGQVNNQCDKKCNQPCIYKECCHGEKRMNMDNTNGGIKVTPMDSTGLVCPVSGEAIDGAEGSPVKYTYLGKEYTFCCAGCVAKFKSEPMNYIKEELKCPVMGEAASKDVFSVLDGVKYYFCCQPCVKKFEKNPDKYLNK